MDEHDAIETLSGGDAGLAARIRRLLSENRRFDEIFAEYLTAAAALSRTQRSGAGNDVLAEEYRHLVAERAAELKGLLTDLCPTDDTGSTTRSQSRSKERKEPK